MKSLWVFSFLVFLGGVCARADDRLWRWFEVYSSTAGERLSEEQRLKKDETLHFSRESFFRKIAYLRRAQGGLLSAQAKISLKTNRQRVVQEVQPLDWKAFQEKIDGPQLPGSTSFPHWRGVEAVGLGDGPGIDLWNFNELRLEYQKSLSAGSGPFSLVLLTEVVDLDEGTRRPVWAFSGRPRYFHVATLDCRREKIVPEGLLDSARRGRGTPRWVFSTTKWETVFRRCLDIRLAGIDTVQLECGPGAPVKSVRFRVGFENPLSRDQWFEVSEFSDLSVGAGGRALFRVDVGGLFPSRKKRPSFSPLLKEIIVSLNGSSEAEPPLFPVERIVFETRMDPRSLGRAPEDDRRNTPPWLSLPFRVEELPLGRQRAVVDLSDLKKRGQLYLKDVRVFFSGPQGPLPQNLGIQKMVLADAREREVPSFLTDGFALLNRWMGTVGGEFLSKEVLGWPEVIDYLHFQSIRPKEINSQGLDLFTLKNLDLFTLKEIADRGVVIRSDRPFLKLLSDGKGLFLEGPGKSLEIELPFRGDVDEETMFSLNFSSGTEQVEQTTLTAFFEGAPALSWHLSLNRPTVFRKKGRLERVRVRLNLKGGRSSLLLTEAALFRRQFLSPRQALGQKLPFSISMPLFPSTVVSSQNVAIPPSDEFVLADLSSFQGETAKLHWETPLKEPLDWPAQLVLTHALPWASFQDNPCSLDLVLHWEKKSDRHSVCFDQPEGTLSLPFTQLSGKASPASGPLRSIEWNVHLTGLSRAEKSDFKMGAAVLEGVGLASLAAGIKNQRVFLADGRALALKEAPGGGNIREGFQWFPLEERSAMDLMEVQGQVEVREHPWFKLESLVITPLPSIPQKLWKSFVTTPRKISSASFLKNFFMFFFFFLLLAVGGGAFRYFHLEEELKGKVQNFLRRREEAEATSSPSRLLAFFSNKAAYGFLGVVTLCLLVWSHYNQNASHAKGLSFLVQAGVFCVGFGTFLFFQRFLENHVFPLGLSVKKAAPSFFLYAYFLLFLTVFLIFKFPQFPHYIFLHVFVSLGVGFFFYRRRP